jgi:2-polyprenyl-3-methyl-5-hydroxy-6-metoxy-1,4-benzoquinol methylase
MTYYTNARPEMQELVPSTSKSILDVGCGEGLFGLGLKQKNGCEVWGIEPDTEAAATAGKNLDKVFNNDFENAIQFLENKKFDTICFNDVLEHMPDPWQCLRQARNLLSNNGTIIASLPNVLYYHTFFNILIDKDWKYEQEGIMDKTHLRWFTQKSLRRMFEDCGYKVISIKGLSPAKTIKMTMLSLLSFGYFDEMKYPQFAVIAKPGV